MDRQAGLPGSVSPRAAKRPPPSPVAPVLAPTQRARSGGGTSAPDAAGLKFEGSMPLRSMDASQPAQSPFHWSSENQMPICCGEPLFTMTADHWPASSPGTVVCFVVPPKAQVSPDSAAHFSSTVWVPLTKVVTAVPDRLALSPTAATSVVAGAPSISYWTLPPIGVGEGVAVG